MCWSAGADLAAGSVITGVGLASVAVVPKDRRIVLAALPVLLGAHQLIESVVWRGVDGTVDPATASAARVAWAAIALPLLPAFMPIAVLLARTASGPAAQPGIVRGLSRGRARARDWWFLGIGLATALVLAHDVLGSDITAAEHGHTLAYGIGITAAPVLLVGYLVGALGPLLGSGDPDLVLSGAAAAVGAAGCALLWRLAFASTWCALAAVISVLMLRWSWRQRARRPSPAR